MTAHSQNILDDWYAGNTKILSFEVLKPDDTPKDLTNAKITYGMVDSHDEWVINKSSLNGDTEVKVIDAANGIFEVYIEPGDSVHLYGTYIHHANVIDTNENEETVATGRVNIFKSYAQRYKTVSQSAFLAGG